MDWYNARSVEAKIRRLTREIAQIDEFFYQPDKEDRGAYAGMLERKRDDMVRSAVLQMHTAIEDLLTKSILCQVLQARGNRARKMRSQKALALRKLLYGAGGIGFEAKLNFAVVLRMLNSKTRARLKELNTLRNKCSHNWLLKAPVRRGKRPDHKKPPLLSYRGHDLHKVDVFKEFAGEYGAIYVKLWLRYG
jgi:hypothetical protein